MATDPQEEVVPLATDVTLKPPIQNDDGPTGAKTFSGLSALAWSAGVAVITGFGGWPTLSLTSTREGAPSLCLRSLQTQGGGFDFLSAAGPS